MVWPLLLHLHLDGDVVFSSMSWSFSFSFGKAVMVWMVAISLLTTGFAHRPVLTAAQIDQAIFLAELGLTAADLCAEQDEGDGGMSMGDCPACHLVASALLPEPVESLIGIELRATAVVLVPARARGLGRKTNPATPVRAPPLA